MSLLSAVFIQCRSSDHEMPNLVPDKISEAPNYWCTWYWQNYLILEGQEVTDPDAKTVYSNVAAREQLNEETIFGESGMAQIMLPLTRQDYYFVIDHGWQDKSIEENTFFTLIMDTTDFPSYISLAPKDRLREMNENIQKLGWKGLGIWVRGSVDEATMRQHISWSKYAGIGYWKIDGGDTDFYASKFKEEIYPELILEHITGAGPVNPKWEIPGLNLYPSVYSNEESVSQELEASLEHKTKKAEQTLDVLKNTDVFRTYDAAPLLVSTTTLQRVHDILAQTAGNSDYRAYLNVQDDCNIAAALGLLVAVKRHPMKTPRLYKGRDLHFQISGNRHVDKKLNEMDRLVRWQRIAPPIPAGYGTYQSSGYNLVDSIVFSEADTWLRATYGKMVRQSAPAIMARNISLPEVRSEGVQPYVLASGFPNGAVAIATEGRVNPTDGWTEPKADVLLKEAEIGKPIGVFGFYESLSIQFDTELPKSITVYAQDLLADRSLDVTKQITVNGNTLTVPGELISKTGTAENDPEDISAPGMVILVSH